MRFPIAEVLADAIRYNLVAAGALVALHTSVVRLECETDRAIVHASRADGEVRVEARRVAITTGLGTCAVPIADPSSRAQISAALFGSDPTLASAEQLLERAEVSRDALHFFRGVGRVAVIGAGPSARGVLMLARQLAPPALYDGDHFSRVTALRLAALSWITGSTGGESAREVDASWRRDPEGGPLIPNTMPAVLAESYAQLGQELINAEARGELEVLQDVVTRIEHDVLDRQEKRGFRIELESGRSLSVDRVVLAAGLRDGLQDARELLGAEIELVPYSVGFEDDPVALRAVRGANELPVYLAGGLIENTGQVLLDRSPASEWVPKALALGAHLAAELEGDAIPRRHPARLTLSGGCGSGQIALELGDELPGITADHLTIGAPWRVALLFERYHLAGRVRVSFRSTPSGGELLAEGLTTEDLHALTSTPEWRDSVQPFLARASCFTLVFENGLVSVEVGLSFALSER